MMFSRASSFSLLVSCTRRREVNQCEETVVLALLTSDACKNKLRRRVRRYGIVMAITLQTRIPGEPKKNPPYDFC